MMVIVSMRVIVSVMVIVSMRVIVMWLLVLSDDCGQEHLTKCAQPLRVFTDNSEFGLVSTVEELVQICPDLNQGLHCIDRYTRRCMTEQQRFHFNHLYNGTNIVIHEICREGPYQTEFLRHAPCMQEVRTDYEECAKSYQQKIQKMTELRNTSDSTSSNGGEAKLRTVCCSFQEYLRCSQTAVLMKCGEESAKFTENFLDRVASSLLQLANALVVLSLTAEDGEIEVRILVGYERERELKRERVKKETRDEIERETKNKGHERQYRDERERRNRKKKKDRQESKGKKETQEKETIEEERIEREIKACRRKREKNIRGKKETQEK
uniref:Uncharacterized protein n=1 Tax=Timema shepardi TaxID=629360 RepID=A0A7R9ATJ9_TIMSH|nr:unnamed protein product [Timema shepardi]